LACGVKGNFAEREHLGKCPEHALDFVFHRLQSETQALQRAGGDAFAVADETQKDAFGADEVWRNRPASARAGIMTRGARSTGNRANR